MTTPSDAESHEFTDADAIARIKDAASAIGLARTSKTADVVSAAKAELGKAALAASDLGVSWQEIGEALGIRRGAAYQRYRRRPSRKVW